MPKISRWSVCRVRMNRNPEAAVRTGVFSASRSGLTSVQKYPLNSCELWIEALVAHAVMRVLQD